mgnify:CR=1 FL=1
MMAIEIGMDRKTYSCISMVTNIGLITVMPYKMSLELSSFFLAVLESFKELSPH